MIAGWSSKCSLVTVIVVMIENMIAHNRTGKYFKVILFDHLGK